MASHAYSANFTIVKHFEESCTLERHDINASPFYSTTLPCSAVISLDAQQALDQIEWRYVYFSGKSLLWQEIYGPAENDLCSSQIFC